MKKNKIEEDVFSVSERTSIIKSIFKGRKIFEKTMWQLDTITGDTLDVKLEKAYEVAFQKLQEFEDDYCNNLPKITISRCPFTHQTFTLSIDTFGLDGPWWDFEQPIRPIEDKLETFFAITGSVDIGGIPPTTSFSIKPGPAVPWVSSRLLSHPSIKAVISQIQVGLYDAYIVLYFSDNVPLEIERINTWGTDYYIAEDANGTAYISSTYDLVSEYDFDLEPWVSAGKLLWISPKDTMLELHQSSEDCPYFNISGYRHPVLLRQGIMKNCIIKTGDDIEKENTKTEKEQNKQCFCTNCGKQLPAEAIFCPYCGNKVR